MGKQQMKRDEQSLNWKMIIISIFFRMFFLHTFYSSHAFYQTFKVEDNNAKLKWHEEKQKHKKRREKKQSYSDHFGNGNKNKCQLQ